MSCHRTILELKRPANSQTKALAGGQSIRSGENKGPCNPLSVVSKAYHPGMSSSSTGIGHEWDYFEDSEYSWEDSASEGGNDDLDHFTASDYTFHYSKRRLTDKEFSDDGDSDDGYHRFLPRFQIGRSWDRSASQNGSPSRRSSTSQVMEWDSEDESYQDDGPTLVDKGTQTDSGLAAAPTKYSKCSNRNSYTNECPGTPNAVKSVVDHCHSENWRRGHGSTPLAEGSLSANASTSHDNTRCKSCRNNALELEDFACTRDGARNTQRANDGSPISKIIIPEPDIVPTVRPTPDSTVDEEFLLRAYPEGREVRAFFAAHDYANVAMLDALEASGFTKYELVTMKGQDQDYIKRRFRRILMHHQWGPAQIETLSYVVSSAAQEEWDRLWPMKSNNFRDSRDIYCIA
ncbi:hypothetical protein CPC08DRAFT_791322 [Agrocybe pediades]|nr:hypothetical protein CPC08DRAFT_791322 [Agrocybe pediades]